MEEIAKNLMWFIEILDIETDFSYKLWFGEKPYVDTVSEDILEYLKLKYPKYYKRISSLRRTRLFRKRNIRATR